MKPMNVRVSIGSAMLLGLVTGKTASPPTTIYLLTYHSSKCAANCAFCSQARSSRSRADMLSRVIWPVFSTEKVLAQLETHKTHETRIQRVCIQVMNYPGVFDDVVNLVKAIHPLNIPVSISCQPFSDDEIKQLADAGVDRIGIPLDLPVKRLFNKIKGKVVGSPYSWETHLETLKVAVNIFGRGKVTTHFIVGLSESDYELISMFQYMADIGVYPSLFAFTPIPGSQMETGSQPSIERYRQIQLARYLVVNGIVRGEYMGFDSVGALCNYGIKKEQLLKIIESGLPFVTSGCPGCNRPYYNERPGGIMYNFPIKPNFRTLQIIKKQLINGLATM